MKALVSSERLEVPFMLLVAGILEGVFRQTVTDFAGRMAIGWGMGALWLTWFTLGGRTQRGPAP